MRSSEEMRQDALECLRLADEAKGQGQKQILIMLAKSWATLADQVEQMQPTARNDAQTEALVT